VRAQLSFAAAWTAEWAFMVALGVVAFRDGGPTAVGVVGFARIAPSVPVYHRFAKGVLELDPGDRMRDVRILEPQDLCVAQRQFLRRERVLNVRDLRGSDDRRRYSGLV
jgi:hypothetical protein